MKKLSLLVLSAMSTFFLTAQTPGTPDLSFGTNGSVAVDFGGTINLCYGSAIQPDQKIVLGGVTFNENSDISFTRLNPDGSLDVGFGSNGIITFVFGGSEDYIYDVVVQPDGFILGAGYSCTGGECKMILVRLTPIGLLDPSFSNDGMVIIDFGPGTESFGEALALQDDGKIIIAGQVVDLNSDIQCGLARINPNGSLDMSFGTNGVLIMNLLSHDTYINNVALQYDKIVVGGRSYYDGDHFLTLARFTHDGVLDASFGINGIVSINLEIDPMILSSTGAMCLDHLNRIVYGCYLEGIVKTDFAVYRFLEDGPPDNSFGDYGLSVTDMDGNSYIYAVTAQYDGKIIAGGIGDGQFAMVRYLENGDPDPDFGSAGTGIVYTDAGTQVTSLNLQEDGLIVAAGIAYPDMGEADFLAARFYSGLDVGVDTYSEQEISLNIYPNPVKDEALISFQIDHPARVKAEVINASGKTIYKLIDEKYAQGKHQLRWNAGSLPSGIYIIKLSSGNNTYSTKVIKVE